VILVSTLAIVVKWAILLPVLLAVLLLAIANDQVVTVHLNPFDAADPLLRIDLALYQVGFILFALGALLGAFIVWNGQAKHRRRARQGRDEARFWHERAARAEHRAPEARPAAQPSRTAAFLPRPERG
jgi:uncharacterized integral membrane protein